MVIQSCLLSSLARNMPIWFRQAKRGEKCLKWHFCARTHSLCCPRPVPVTDCFAFPSLDPYFFQNHIQMLLAHLTWEGMGPEDRDVATTTAPQCLLVPARLVAPACHTATLSPCTWLGLNLLWKGESLIVSFPATGIPPLGAKGNVCKNPEGKAWKAPFCASPCPLLPGCKAV